MGHDIGDQLLTQIALRLTENQELKSLTTARLGGNEFTILLDNVAGRNDIAATADQLLKIFRTPFTCSGYKLSATASIGIALCPDDGQDTVTLIKHADMAMYQAKETGRNHYSFFPQSLLPASRDALIKRML